MRSPHYILIWIIIFIFSCKSNSLSNNDKKINNNFKNEEVEISFLGKWENIDQTSRIFTINLFKKDSKIVGNYCSITNNGNKIDCSVDDEQNLKAIIVDSILKVEFYSFFGGTNGVSEIELENENIIWTIVKSPVGEFHCPMKDRLYRVE
ncbi:hypothetical protein [uncultured Aquimarina sp.]|uniref:hypothetical protein n=1 Tax=uncultured Aquimarina sp. TaxID=575652 RepID=UPI0026175405|nr:hypothetical protein [uncultured Aquimarina sp.]